MVHGTRNKPWKISSLCIIALLFTITSRVVAQDTETTQLQQNVLQSPQFYEVHDEDHIKRGKELYDQALERLEPLINVQLPNSKKSPLRDKATGITGLYHIALDSIWHFIDTYASITFTSTSEHTSHEQPHTPSSTQPEPSTQQDRRQRLLEATRLLEEAGNTFGNKDSLFLLAEMYFYEKYTQPRDYKLAFDYYQKLANTGNATAQQMIGFMYATGIGNAIQRDQAQAFLHHSFAALGEDTAAEMTLGYRYLLGIGTEQSYVDAAYYYKLAAKKAIDHYLSGPPGGLAPPLPKLRLADDKGGLYGQGASVMTDKYHRASADKSVSIDEVLQYLRYLAFTKKDVEAQLRLGEMYYHGSRNVRRNFGEALYFFKAVVSKLPSSTKLPDSLVKSEHGKAIGQAAGYLGKMFLRGEGVKANSEMAYKWFIVGTELQDSASMNGLGMIELNGEKKDYESAIFHFKQAVNLKNSDARVNLALVYIKDATTLAEGIELFQLAAESSKHLLAYWYLGQIYEQGIGMERPSSQHAVSFYKAIAERGDWLNPTIDNAYDAYMNGDMESALLSYMLAAERGYETAQSNVAYLLDTDKVALNLPERLGLEESPKRDNYSEELALIYYSRSANQNNVDSRVKMGDYYYRGIGTEVNYDMAAACYRVAAELEASPMAMWNLGWMYENGIGVAKDFYLAKRFYDNALTANGNAYLPVKLSLIKLYAKYYWAWLTGGDVDQEFFSDEQKAQHEQQQQKGSSWDDGQRDGLGLSEEAAAIQEARRRKQIEGHDDHDRQWGEQSTEDELRRQYNKHKELEDYENYDDLNGGNGADDDEYSEQDELIESLIILGIGILVGWLVYVRQFGFGNNAQAAAAQHQQRQRQQEEEQQQQHLSEHHDNSNGSSPPSPPPSQF